MLDTPYMALIARLNTIKKQYAGSAATTISEKSFLDYVTNIDMALNADISALIQELFPHDLILSEEGWHTQLQGNTAPIWLIDPLDGTSNFISDIPFYAISLAHIIDNKTNFACVIDLTNNEVFFAQYGKGAYCNDKPLQKQHDGTSFLALSTGFLTKHSDAIPILAEQVKFRLLGSQALHLCYVAAGRFRGAVNIESKVWDDIAGALIVNEAGGIFTSTKVSDISNPSQWREDGLSAGVAMFDKDDDLGPQLANIIHNHLDAKK